MKPCKCEKGKIWIQTDLANYSAYAFQKTLDEQLEEGYPVYVQIAGTPPGGCGKFPKPPCKKLLSKKKVAKK